VSGPGSRLVPAPKGEVLPRAEPIPGRALVPTGHRVGERGRDQVAGSLERRGGWILWLLAGLLVGLTLLAVAYYALPPR